MSVVINCKECANEYCKNNGCEYAPHICQYFMPKEKEGADIVEKLFRCALKRLTLRKLRTDTTKNDVERDKGDEE